MRDEIKEKRYLLRETWKAMFAAWECMLRGPPGYSCEGQRYRDLNRAINISACRPVGGDVNDL